MLTSNLRQQAVKQENPEFLHDVRDFFSGRRAGHMSNWLYAEANFEGDKAAGGVLWQEVIEQARADGIYYVFQKERDIIKLFVSDAENFFDCPSRLVDLGPGSPDAVRNKVLPIITAGGNNLSEYLCVDLCQNSLDMAVECVHDNVDVSARLLKKDFIKDVFVYGEEVEREMAVLFGLTLFNMLIDPRVRDLPNHYLQFSLKRLRTHFAGKDCYLAVTQDSNQDIVSLKRAYKAIEKHYRSLLHRIERDLDVVGEYDPDKFIMDVEYFADTNACALSFVALEKMSFHIQGELFSINKGERFYFHNAYKFGEDEFLSIAAKAGFSNIVSYSEPGNPCILHILKAGQ